LILVENVHPCLTIFNPTSAKCKSAQVCSKNTIPLICIPWTNDENLIYMYVCVASNSFAPNWGSNDGMYPGRAWGQSGVLGSGLK